MTQHKRRILFLVEAAGAGVGRHVADLSSGLARKGCEVHVLYSPTRADRAFVERMEEEAKRSGVVVRTVPMKRNINPLADFRALYAVRRYLRRNGPFDIIHGHSSKAGALGRLLRLTRIQRTPVVYTPHALATLSPGLSAVMRRIYGGIECSLGRFLTDAIIAVSKEEARHALDLGIPASKVHYIPNGVDPEEFRVSRVADLQALKERENISPSAAVLGFVGRLDYQKAPEVLLRAFGEMVHASKCCLVFVGDGPQRTQLEQEAASSGISERVKFLGFRQDGRDLISMFDILVLPSRYEGLPYVLLEAMAVGLPIVATDVSGNSELVHGGENGFLVPPESSAELAHVLDGLIEMPESERRRLGEAGRRTVEKYFTLEQMVTNTLHLYSVL